MIRGVGAYVNTQVDKVAIGGFSSAATMGRYEIATDVATTPTSEINTPMIGAMFPVMAKVQHDHARRRELYLQVLYWSALICTSTAVGVALVSDDMVDLVLGSQWNDAKPLFPWLALAFGMLGLSSSVSSAFEVIGLPGISARLQWARFAALLVAIAVVALFWPSARSVAIARFAVTLAITPPMFFMLARTLELGARDILFTLWRPLAASVAMAILVLGINALLWFAGPPRLAIDVVLGAVVYAAAIFATWHMVGRPNGAETQILTYFGAAFDRTKTGRLARGG
jgi:O-antigen/teichoic acid export membrane protein